MRSLRFGIAAILLTQVSLTVPAFAQKSDASTPFARGCEQMMKKDFASALTSFSEAISDNANDVNAYFRRGQSFFCIGNYNEAIRDFGRATEKGAMDPNLHLWTGTAYAKLGKDADAIISYERAMRLNPKLAGTASESKNEAAPVASITTSTSLDASKVTSKPAQTLSLGTSQNALDDYKIAAKNILDNASGSFIAGVVYSGIINQAGHEIDLGQIDDSKSNQPSDKSEHLSSKAPHSDSDAPGLSSNASGLSAKRDVGKLKAELKELNDQINAQPQNPKLFFRRARVQLLLDNNSDGLEDINRAIDLDKTSPHLYLARAFYFYQHDDEKAADRDIRRAQELNPIIPGVLTFDTAGANSAKGKL